MAFDLTPYMGAISAGADAANITGQLVDAFPVGSYAGFIQSITGEIPTVVNMGDRRAKILLTESQIKKVQQWIESQAFNLLKSGEPPRVEYGFGTIINPVVVKYSIPTALAIFGAGFLVAKVFFK